MREYPDRIHCFSRHTKISIELPIRFEEESDDAESNTAVYIDSLGGEAGARVIARAIGSITKAWSSSATKRTRRPGTPFSR